jgi:putative tryptophan/tyrosine transport system substrate-binding protein
LADGSRSGARDCRLCIYVDPVRFGLVAAFNRPGGNLTGISVLNVAVTAKRVELLHELVPNAALVAMLANPTNPFTETETKEMRSGTQSLGLPLQVAYASKETDFEAAVDSLVRQHAGIPAMYPWRSYPAAGGLVSYGTNPVEAWRQVGIYVGEILKGAKSADLPVQQVTKLELVINMKTAKTLGLTVPISLLGRADELIE